MILAFKNSTVHALQNGTLQTITLVFGLHLSLARLPVAFSYILHRDYPFLSLRLLPSCCLPTSPTLTFNFPSPTLTFNFPSLVFFLSTCISLMFCYTPLAHPIPVALFDWLLQVLQIKHKSKDLVLGSVNETECGVLCFWSWLSHS